MSQKLTKIICTIGPASSDVKMLLAMIREGMDVVRINFSHGTGEANLSLIQNVRGAARALGKPIAIMQDLQGPRVRTSKIVKEGLELKEGEIVWIRKVNSKKAKEKSFEVSYRNLSEDLKRGNVILIDDGLFNLKVVAISGKAIKCKVILGGLLTNGRGMNFPGVYLNIPAITKKDRKDLEFGIAAKVDFVALSFVQKKEDIISLKRLLKIHEDRETPRTKIIAKIEKEEAFKNLDEILEEADGIMVARGDLGIEMDPARLPLIQKQIIKKCLESGKPVIVATQMLDSMQRNPRPTRAEISDVANAVIDHADAVMLSQETATGKYPLEAVHYMARICKETEQSHYDDLIYNLKFTKKSLPVLAISRSAAIVARDVGTDTILITTRSGFSARALVCNRPQVKNIIAVTNSENVQRELALSWGIKPYLAEGFSDTQDLVSRSLKLIEKEGIVKKGEQVVILTGFRERGNGWSTALRVAKI